ncbi:DUF748 domain-containing protein [Nitrospira sp. Nam74]
MARHVLKKTLWVLLGLIAILVVTALIAASLLEDRLRAYVEQEANRRATDYVIQIKGLTLHPLRLSMDLHDVLVAQKGHPDPPIITVQRATAGVRWSSLLRARVMGDLLVDGPTIQVTRPQSGPVQENVREHAPTADELEVWQDKVVALPRVGLTLAVRNGRVAYFESQGQPVLELDDVRLDVGPLDNTKAQQGDYPAPVTLRAHLPHGGELKVDGAVDVLAKPHAAGAVDVHLGHVDLEPLAPVADRYHTKLHGGILTLDGHVEYAPWRKQYALRDLALENLVANYVYEPAAPKPEKEAAKKGGQKAVEAAQEPAAEIRIDRTKLTKCELGVVHAGVDPPYRVFVTDLSADLSNFSTRLKDKAAELTAQGRFMATGDLNIRGLFRPDPKDPDFDLSVRLVRSQVKMLNDLLMAHGKIDVAGGDFSVYSQLKVQHGKIAGYVKPIIRDLDVYDTDQERGKGVIHKAYEAVVGGATELLQNTETEEAATKVQVTGTIQNAQLDAWQAAMRLVQNAFFQIIIPRFERPVRPGNTAQLTIE